MTEGGIEQINTKRSGSSDDNVLMDLAVEMVVKQSGRHGTEGRVSVDQGTIANAAIKINAFIIKMLLYFFDV